MASVNISKNQANSTWFAAAVTKRGMATGDWKDFLNGLGGVEGNSQYNAQNSQGYIGMYQFARWGTGVFVDLGFASNIGAMLGVTDGDQFRANPIAQELAAIMEFSGIPDVTISFSSKYSYVRNAFATGSYTKAQFDALLGQTFTINWTDGENGPAVLSQNITITPAGISAAAHLTGQDK